jgi:glycosyltransferase involved in cell wall biosynthesis
MLLGRQARVASAVIACSEAVARQLAPSVGVITIHPPIASHAGGDGEGFRRRHGIPGEVQLVAAVGSITPTRGQDQLLLAVAALRREHPDLHCVIEGEPFLRRRDLEFSAELDRLVGELGLREVVVRTTRTGSVSDLYAAADLIVSPSTTHPESFGRVPLEAATAGTPSVLTAVGAIPELHRDGVSAVLVAPGDVDGLALAIARVLDDPALARRLTIGGAELAARIADPERSLAAFQALIEPRISR